MKERDNRRERGATGKPPFVAAVSTDAQGHPIEIRFSQVRAFSKDVIIEWATKHLCIGDEVVSDGFNCFNGLDEAGFDHRVIITGGGPESVKIAEFKWVNTIIGNVKRSLHGSFHAVNKRHFSRYLQRFVIVLTADLICASYYQGFLILPSGLHPSRNAS